MSLPFQNRLGVNAEGWLDAYKLLGPCAIVPNIFKLFVWSPIRILWSKWV
jgi:hypothetical protein